ncbi:MULTISPECIES: RHS repeat-associated core domain-containing protein [unclassified Luteococcus]|uniref:RHS repeat-associated core domain-containing protein n=1 Tax=unclassified Luteococcus TaxID=2639923 RepID=UPI00313E4E2F
MKTARAGANPQTMVDQTYGYTTGGVDRVNVQTMIDTTGEFIPAGVTTTYSYDSMNRLTSAVEKNGATTNASFTYAYDLNGNRTKATIAGLGAGANDNALVSARTFDHNRADELTIADGKTAGLGWDANGDETAAQGWLAGSVQGRSNVKTSSVGDVAQWTVPDTGQTFAFTNAQVLPTGTRNLTWAHEVTYTYNPVGLEGYTSPNGQGQVKLFTMPNGQTLGYEVGGKMEYFHKDRLGSVVAMTGDDGGKEAYYRYDPYGQPRSYYRWSDQAKANTLMDVGLPRDFSTGLIRMGARWYDPTIARFTTADPSGQEQNPYLYAEGNPINNTDPTGLWHWQSSVLGWGAGALATAVVGAGTGNLAVAGAAGLFVGGAVSEMSDQTIDSGGVTDYGDVLGSGLADMVFGLGG